MSEIHFSENITKFRHEKKVTQEQLAEFIGVTKASVSKWENGLTMPDIVLLPKIAAYFDVSIDVLMGYEPQLSKEQIQKIYLELSQAFAKEEFETVLERSRNLVKEYYSCYPFLLQIVCLWLNHYMLAEEERGIEILKEAVEICNHVMKNCKDITICNEVIFIRATLCLQMKNPKQAIDDLEDLLNPIHMKAQGEGVLISAYQMIGDMDKANNFTQITMYMNLCSLISASTNYIALHMDDLTICEETMYRIEVISKAYHMDNLHFNVMVLFYYQMALVYVMHNRKQEAVEQLEKFVKITDRALSQDNCLLHSDDYFDSLDYWIEQLELGGQAPREKKFIQESMIQGFENPAFDSLKDEPEYQKLKQFVERII